MGHVWHDALDGVSAVRMGLAVGKDPASQKPDISNYLNYESIAGL